MDEPLLAPPPAASAALVAVTPALPAARPSAVLLGHLVSVAAGFTTASGRAGPSPAPADHPPRSTGRIDRSGSSFTLVLSLRGPAVPGVRTPSGPGRLRRGGYAGSLPRYDDGGRDRLQGWCDVTGAGGNHEQPTHHFVRRSAVWRGSADGGECHGGRRTVWQDPCHGIGRSAASGARDGTAITAPLFGRGEVGSADMGAAVARNPADRHGRPFQLRRGGGRPPRPAHRPAVRVGRRDPRVVPVEGWWLATGRPGARRRRLEPGRGPTRRPSPGVRPRHDRLGYSQREVARRLGSFDVLHLDRAPGCRSCRRPGAPRR
ncbi:hypothetical protein [Actinomadura rubrisoli]|uniref:hypothetical protein n=1 Tax=Actinomadura rubrisoli TaxID=2530368 RepID=UPI003C7C4572